MVTHSLHTTGIPPKHLVDRLISKRGDMDKLKALRAHVANQVNAIQYDAPAKKALVKKLAAEHGVTEATINAWARAAK